MRKKKIPSNSGPNIHLNTKILNFFIKMDVFLILKQFLLTVDAILIGAGAGLSASGGYDFDSHILLKNELPDYYRMGYKTFWDVLEKYWDVTDQNELEYYGFWASQVNLFLYNYSHSFHGNYHYQAKTLQPYKDLYRLLVSERYKYHKQKNNDSSYFIITTNVDHQFQLAGFPDVNILSPQGDFSYLQCSLPCSNATYDSFKYMKKIIDNINRTTMKARLEDIPRCPKCGRRMIPNVRSDDRFIEDLHVFNYVGYNQFIQRNFYSKDSPNNEKKVLLLELGVGYSTPSIIRFPFDKLVKTHKNCVLIRFNKDYPDLPEDPMLNNRVFAIKDDIADLISRLTTELLDNDEI